MRTIVVPAPPRLIARAPWPRTLRLAHSPSTAVKVIVTITSPTQPPALLLIGGGYLRLIGGGLILRLGD